jgi:hypothetical protein
MGLVCGSGQTRFVGWFRISYEKSKIQIGIRHETPVDISDEIQIGIRHTTKIGISDTFQMKLFSETKFNYYPTLNSNPTVHPSTKSSNQSSNL